MPNSSIQPVILSGGSGTRLWPISRKGFPKQFISLFGNQKTPIAETAKRVLNPKQFNNPIVMCNEAHRFTVADQLQSQLGITPEIILEPVARNTAAAIIISALHTLEKGEDSIMLVMPSDHIIKNETAFIETAEKGIDAVNAGNILTFGITPKYPETGYGYIEMGEPTDKHNGEFAVKGFVEKPDHATAYKYMEGKRHLWNSGIFMFKASTLIDEATTHCPDTLALCRESYKNSKADLDFLRLDSISFKKLPSISIDYAIMEKTKRAAVLPLECGWIDAGCWDVIWKSSDKDANGNFKLGQTHIVDSNDCYVRADGPAIATLGVENLVIISTDDAVLVMDKSRSQEIKQLTELVEEEDESLVSEHKIVHRPWGFYEHLNSGSRHQVKRICIKPGQKLSLQMHYHRAEHWVVVSGTAKIVRGEEEVILSENQSIYIPVGEKHRVENPGKVDLDIIEVQSGEYLKEDDIVRFEDYYGRNTPKVTKKTAND